MLFLVASMQCDDTLFYWCSFENDIMLQKNAYKNHCESERNEKTMMMILYRGTRLNDKPTLSFLLIVGIFSSKNTIKHSKWQQNSNRTKYFRQQKLRGFLHWMLHTHRNESIFCECIWTTFMFLRFFWSSFLRWTTNDREYVSFDYKITWINTDKRTNTANNSIPFEGRPKIFTGTWVYLRFHIKETKSSESKWE